MAGLWVGGAGPWWGTGPDPQAGYRKGGWAPEPSPKALERWARLSPPRLGDWCETRDGGMLLPRPPAARYPDRVDLNVLYYPTHFGAFAFGWFLFTGSVKHAAHPVTGVPLLGGSTPHVCTFFTEWPLNPAAPQGLRRTSGVRLWALGEYQLSVLEAGQESLWAVPCVDLRYFANQDWRKGPFPGGPSVYVEPVTNRMAWLRGLIGTQTTNYYYVNQQDPTPPDPELPINLESVYRSEGTVGSLIDHMSGAAGLRAMWYPPAWTVDGSAEFWGGEAQSFEYAEERLNEWFARPEVLDRIRDGGPPSLTAPPVLPTTVLAQGAGSGAQLDIGELLTGVQGDPQLQHFVMHLPVRPFKETGNLDGTSAHPKFRDALAYLAGRLLAWTLRPFMVRTAGMVPGCHSALVGMYEFGNGFTVAHGLSADTWWSAGEWAPPATAVVRCIQMPTGPYTPPYTRGTFRLGRYVYAPEDNLPCIGDLVTNKLIFQGGSFLGVFTGEWHTINGTSGPIGAVPVYALHGDEKDIIPVHPLGFSDFTWNGNPAPYGSQYLYASPAGPDQGTFGATTGPGVLMGSGSSGGGNPWYGPYQWARGDHTGFTTLGTGAVYFGPVGAVGAGSATASVSGSDHTVSINTGGGLVSVTGPSSLVQIGDTSSAGTFDFVKVNTRAMHIHWPGSAGGPLAGETFHAPGIHVGGSAVGGPVAELHCNSPDGSGLYASGGGFSRGMFLPVGSSTTVSVIGDPLVLGNNVIIGGAFSTVTIGGSLSLGSPLGVGNGGTGVGSFNTGEAVYGNGTGALASSAYMKFSSGRPWFQDPTSGRWHAIGSVSI